MMDEMEVDGEEAVEEWREEDEGEERASKRSRSGSEEQSEMSPPPAAAPKKGAFSLRVLRWRWLTSRVLRSCQPFRQTSSRRQGRSLPFLAQPLPQEGRRQSSRPPTYRQLLRPRRRQGCSQVYVASLLPSPARTLADGLRAAKSKPRSSTTGPSATPTTVPGSRQTTLFGLAPGVAKPVETKGGKKRKVADEEEEVKNGLDAFLKPGGGGAKKLPREGEEFEETQGETQVETDRKSVV